MGTAVMHSQDCLSPYRKSNNGRQSFIEVVYHHKAKSSLQYEQAKNFQSHSQSRRKAKSKGAEVQKRPFKSNEVCSEMGKKFVKNQNQNSQGKVPRNNGRREQSEPVAKNLVTGQVTILKRGQAVENLSPMMRASPDPAPRNPCVEAEPTGFETETCGGGAGKKCGPSLKFEEEWAGPAFANSVSPSPRCLPVPMFFVKRVSQENVRCEEEKIDTLATRGLRRLLGLD